MTGPQDTQTDDIVDVVFRSLQVLVICLMLGLLYGRMVVYINSLDQTIVQDDPQVPAPYYGN